MRTKQNGRVSLDPRVGSKNGKRDQKGITGRSPLEWKVMVPKEAVHFPKEVAVTASSAVY